MIGPTLYEFATDPLLCNQPTTSLVQGMVLKAMDGDALTAEETEAFIAATGRTSYPGVRFNNVALAGGAGGGKDSFIVKPSALYAGIYGGYEKHLVTGQQGVVVIVAQDRDAARITFGYMRATVEASALMMTMVDDVLADEIRLKNGIAIRVFPCTAKAQRGSSIVFACLNECAFYRFEGAADSDVEIESSSLRGMRFPDARLLKVSTTYLPEGILYRDWKKGWGPQDHPNLLAFQIPTEVMWPGAKAWCDQVRASWDDPDRAARELDAKFLDASITAYIPRAEVERCVAHDGDVPWSKLQTYFAFADPSGLTEGDTWTFCIAHMEGGAVVIDVLRGYDGTDEQQMAQEHADLMRAYRVVDMQVMGDAFSGDLAAKLYRTKGAGYRRAPWDRSEAYVRTRRMIRRATTGDPGMRLSIPNHDRLVSQFSRLEVAYLEGGRVRVDHPRRKGAHDDYSNAVALAASVLENLRLYEQDARAEERPSNPDDPPNPYDSALADLVAWARKNGAMTEDALDAYDAGELTEDQQHRLRVDLVEHRARRDWRWNMKLRMERGGIPMEEKD